jgi:arylsulfatase A-like enzyme
VKVSQHGLTSADPVDPKGIFSITAAACEFLEVNRDRPFFAYLPHYAVHSRLQGRPDTMEHFQAKPKGQKHNNPAHAACLADLDTGVGMVLQKLRDLGLEQNTLVLFTSDNGGNAVSQEPLRGMKGCYYEGGIRVPMIVRWPAVVKPGSTSDVPVINVDFYPTFLAAAAAGSPSTVLDGASLLPLLRGEPRIEREAIFWHFPGYLDGPVPRGRDPVFRTRPVSVIRQGDWKLHLYHEEWQLEGGREQLSANNAVELYNLTEDPGERRNLAASHPQQRDKLLASLLSWIAQTSAPLPSQPNPAWDPKAAAASGGKSRS